MPPRHINPEICNIALDANALDRGGSTRDALVDRFVELKQSGVLRVVIPGGVRTEVSHPSTPGHVQKEVLPEIFNLRPSLNSAQRASRRRVEALLRGNAQPGTHSADASHVSEASETGCSYFITEDRRILSKRDDLRQEVPSLLIVTLEEFFDIYDEWVEWRPEYP